MPVGGFKEVRKIYNHLISPIKDPDYDKRGKVFCLIDTDVEAVDVPDYFKHKNLYFQRLLIQEGKSTLVEVTNNTWNPPTEIEDCLNPIVFYNTILEFANEDKNLKQLLLDNNLVTSAKYSADFLDLRKAERKVIKDFFDGGEGFNKVRFAKKYVELIQKSDYEGIGPLDWIEEIKTTLYRTL